MTSVINLSSTAKLFADDTSLFSVVNNINLSEFHLNIDLALESVKAFHPAVFYNNIPVAHCSTNKHLGMYLDKKLNLGHHITKNMQKPTKVITKLHNILSHRGILSICKCFVWPNLDYGDFIYDQSISHSFYSKTESVQYNIALAITGAMLERSQTKIYNEPGLKSLGSKWWFRHLCTPCKNNRLKQKVCHHIWIIHN